MILCNRVATCICVGPSPFDTTKVPVCTKTEALVLWQMIFSDESGERTSCRDLGTTAPLVTVQQAHCYPKRYFGDVPAARKLQDGYSIHMRPGSTDYAVMSQVRGLFSSGLV